MLNNSSTTPRVLQFALLQKNTDGFSEKHKLGHGGFGEVYKGTLDNGEEIAVKKLYYQPGVDDVQFKTEFENLMRVQHQNIVQLVGYCYEKHNEYFELQNGKTGFAEKEYRILCFEYLQGGSLDNHLYEEQRGLDWHTRYKIINGICEGLNYLHSGLEGSILHLDLKPANILLDKNMVPKIADFGLSRLFGETHTHITKNLIGTLKYMPPEYMIARKISKKYDVFSLGVIIIEIMTGRKGYSQYCEMSTSEQFIDLVYQHWKHRIEKTPMHTSPEEDCKQVKRCIEIALKCIDSERHKRPTIGDIINNLRDTETMVHEMPMPFSQESGSVSTSHFKREMVHNGKEVSPGRQGKRGRQGGEDEGKIKVGPSEFLVEVSGTTGPYICAVADVVKSLTLVTNAVSYGPFGQGGGTAFHTSMQSNGSIVGFFGRAGYFLHAIGVYVKPNQPTLAASRNFEREMVRDENQVNSELETRDGERGKEDGYVLAKIGPWGGNGGMAHDMKVVPHRLESLTICSAEIIDSLAFSYSDLNGKQHTVGPWGGRGGSAYTIRLGAFAHLKGISGTVGSFGAIPNVITSLKFDTDISRSYGPFGQGGGTPFSVPVENHGSIVGFFGRAGSYVEALGVYIRTY